MTIKIIIQNRPLEIQRLNVYLILFGNTNKIEHDERCIEIIIRIIEIIILKDKRDDNMRLLFLVIISL